MFFNTWKMLLLCLATLSIVCLSDPNEDPPPIPASHFIVTNGALILKEDLVVHLNLLHFTANDVSTESGVCQINVTISVGNSISHTETWTIDPGTEPEDYSKVIRVSFDIRSFMKTAKSYLDTVPLSIKSSDSLNSNTFNYSADIPVSQKEESLTVQTDKETYQPGEMILMRVFSLYSNWDIPLQENLLIFGMLPTNLITIIITNSFGVPVMISRPLRNVLGVVTHTYLIPEIAQEGEWTISAKIFSDVRNKTIRVVRKGFKPFVVNLDAPRYHPVGLNQEVHNPILNVRVQASYPSGLPVNGDVTLTITLGNSTQSTHRHQLREKLENGLKMFHLDLNELKSQLKMSAEDKWFNKTILVSAQVEELYRRSSVLVENAVIEFNQHGFDLDFHEITPGVFRPGLKYVGHVSLKSKVERFLPSKTPKEVTIISNSENWSRNISVNILSNGVARFAIDTLKTDSSLEIQASYYDEDVKEMLLSEKLKISPFDAESPNRNFIQVTLENESPVLQKGETLHLLIKTTFPAKRVFYEVFSQKLLVLAGTANNSESLDTHRLTLTIPDGDKHPLTTSRIVVWTQDPKRSIVSDSLLFVVEKARNKVELSAKRESIGNAEGIEIEIKAPPKSVVYLFATATPPIFEDAEQEKEQQIALEKMKRYTKSLRSSYLTDVLDSSCKECSTIPSLSSDSMKVFNESQGLVFGTCDINDKSDAIVQKMIYRDILERPSSMEFHTAFWETVEIWQNESEKLTIWTNTSDSLYTISAVSVNEDEGMNVAEPVQVRITRPVVFDVSYPERIVEGESFNMEISLFNRQPKNMQLTVSVNELPPIEIRCNGEMISGDIAYQHLKLGPNEFKKLFFHMKATSSIDSEYTLETMTTLKIEEASYVERKYFMFKSHSHLGRFMNIFSLRSQFKLKVREQPTVSKSILTIYGDVMAPAREYVLRSLKHSNIVDELTNMKLFITSNTLGALGKRDDMEFYDSGFFHFESLVVFLWRGIQHVFHQQHLDGSFSSTQPNQGTIKYTSIMLDAMSQWQQADVFWVEEKIIGAAKWLIEVQNDDGSYSEATWKSKAEDEVQLDTLRLTGHVLLSLIKSHDLMEDDNKKKSEDAIVKSSKYLKRQLLSGDADNDRYALSIISYALMLLDDDDAPYVFERRNKLKAIQSSRPPSQDLRHESLEIEATAYDLLTHLSMAELKDAMSAAKWLVQRMGPDGRFATSEATMIALRAISRYRKTYRIHMREHDEASIELKYSDGKQEEIPVHDSNFVHRIVFDERNNTMIDDVEVNVIGEELLLFQLENKHEASFEPPSDEIFRLDHSISDLEGGHQLKLCMEWMLNQSSGPVMAEVPVLSGYNLDVERSKEMLMGMSVSHVYLQGGMVYLALDEFQIGESRCLRLDFVEGAQVFDRKRKFIQVYSLLNTNRRSSLAYHDGRPNPEDVCPLCKCDVRRRSKRAAKPADLKVADGDVVIIIIKK